VTAERCLVAPQGSEPAPDPDPSGAPTVRFAGAVRLTKDEVFGACQALADADRHLVRAGHHAEADALGDLFELLEGRLTGPPASALVGLVLEGQRVHAVPLTGR
jgi:hypothetical protein